MRFIIIIFFSLLFSLTPFTLLSENRVLNRNDFNFVPAIDFAKHLSGTDYKFVNAGLAFQKNVRGKLKFFIIGRNPIVNELDGYSYPLIGILELKNNQLHFDQVLPSFLNKSEELRAKFQNKNLSLKAIGLGKDNAIWLLDAAEDSLIKLQSKTGQIEDRVFLKDLLADRPTLKNLIFQSLSILPSEDFVLAAKSAELDQDYLVVIDSKLKSSAVYSYLAADFEQVVALQSIGPSELLVLESSEVAVDNLIKLALFKLELPGIRNGKDGQIESLIAKKEVALGTWPKRAGRPTGMAILESTYTVAVSGGLLDAPESSMVMFDLKEPLLSWRYTEWVLVSFMGLITLATVLIALAVIFQTIFRRKKVNHAE